MTGTQPRPLRYRGRLNRRGRKARRRLAPARRFCTDDRVDAMPARGWGKHARAEAVRDLFVSERVRMMVCATPVEREQAAILQCEERESLARKVPRG